MIFHAIGKGRTPSRRCNVSAVLGMEARNSSEIGICAKAFSMDSVKRAAAFPVGATNLI